MSRLPTTVILYLLMLVIPTQGFAASTMLYCGPTHQHALRVQGTDHRSARSNADEPAADQGYQGHAAEFLDPVSYAVGDEEINLTGSEHAACAMSAAVPASSLRFEAAERVIERIAAKQFLNIGFVTDGPIRPPRSFPA